MAKQQGRSGGSPAEPQAFGADYAAEAAMPANQGPANQGPASQVPANAPLGFTPAPAAAPQGGQQMRRGPQQGQGQGQMGRGPGGRMQGQGQGQMRGRRPQQGQ